MDNKWICERLTDCLKFPVPEDLVQYILGIDNARDLEAYLKTLLNVENPHHREFLTEILQKKKKEKASNKKKKIKPASSQNENSPSPTNTTDETEESASKKKLKFVNLYSNDGQNKEIVFLKGRHHCDCQASKHSLINNCMQCGRIVCQQEGSGPCLFCGNLVCSAEEQQVLNSSTKKSTTLYNRLIEQKRPQGWEAALAQRNRLLEYDRTSERRTRVTDDDSDYFCSGSVWLSKGEREKFEKYQQSLREKKHASRRNQTFTFDFAGRQVVEEKNYDGEADEDAVAEITDMAKKDGFKTSQNKKDTDHHDGDLHPGYCGPAPQFDITIKSQSVSNPGRQGFSDHIKRIQDASIQEMDDKGACLSMHQPWASLLVTGIKIHEGRSWYTAHRGRLWIASTVQPPDNETIQSVENMYNVLYPNEKIIFPKFYATACLLGFVHVADCLPQEEYRQRFPDGESESPFVLICTDPVALSLRFPVSGKHKIYSLDSKIHQAAVKSLQRMAKMEASL